MKMAISEQRMEELSRFSFEIAKPSWEIKKAVLVGIKFTGENADVNVLDTSPDVYSLLEENTTDDADYPYDIIGVLTGGWAAPVNNDESDEIAPSAHKDRRRVNLAMFAYSSDQTSSVLSFDDDADSIVYETRGQGALADSFKDFLMGISW
jgi:hypothetical protein